MPPIQCNRQRHFRRERRHIGRGIFLSKDIDEVLVRDNAIRNVRYGIFSDANSININGATLDGNEITANEQAVVFSSKQG